MPAPLPLTAAWWEAHGLYLIDDRQVLYLWVGRDAVPQLIVDVFGASDYRALQGGKVRIRIYPRNHGNSLEIHDLI